MSEVAIAARAILALEKDAAKSRRRRVARGKRKPVRKPDLSAEIRHSNRAADATAKRWGKTGDWLDWLLKVNEAAAVDPQRFRPALVFLDRGGAPNVAWAWVQDNRDRPADAMTPLPPDGRCASIVSDLATWKLIDVNVAARALLEAMPRAEAGELDLVPLAPAARSNGELRTVSNLWGKGPEWLRPILDVCDAAAADPDRFGFLVGLMDRDKKKSAARAFARMERILDVDRVKNVRPAEGKYHTLVMDVPWCEDNISEGSDHNYAQMTFDQILGLKAQVEAWAADDFCHLWFWYKNNTIALACQAVLHYGFTIKSNHTWHKPRWGQGRYARNNTEHVLFAVRGEKGCKDAYMRTPTAHTWPYPDGPESTKPDGFYRMVLDLSHGPYGEAFQRQARPGFVNLYQPAGAPAAMLEAAE